MKLGELYVLIHHQPLSRSTVLHSGALAKGQEGEASVQLARARMHGRIRDMAQNTRTEIKQQERKWDRCYSRCLHGQIPQSTEVPSMPVCFSRTKLMYVRCTVLFPFLSSAAFPQQDATERKDMTHYKSLCSIRTRTFRVAETHWWETLGRCGGYPDKRRLPLRVSKMSSLEKRISAGVIQGQVLPWR